MTVELVLVSANGNRTVISKSEFIDGQDMIFEIDQRKLTETIISNLPSIMRTKGISA